MSNSNNSTEAGFSCAQSGNEEGGAPLTAPAPLTTSETDMLELAHLFDDARESGKPLTLSAESCAALHAAMTLRPAAPAPQQSELTEERIAELARQEGDEDTHGFIFNKDGRFSVISFARAIEREVLAKAASAAPVQTAEPKRIPDMLTVETIQGAIAFGRMGINPPPSTDHWGNEFWQIGRQLAKLGETSAWDNVTPVDVAVPVQADQEEPSEEAAYYKQLWQQARAELDRRALPAQAEQAEAVRAAEWISVEDRVPEDNQTVAILYWPYDNHENPQVVGVAEHVDGGFYTHEGDLHHYPSHWANLPAAPSTATSNDTGALGGKGAES